MRTKETKTAKCTHHVGITPNEIVCMNRCGLKIPFPLALAAPDLLEACKLAVEYADHIPNGHLIKAAIAKAKS